MSGDKPTGGEPNVRINVEEIAGRAAVTMRVNLSALGLPGILNDVRVFLQTWEDVLGLISGLRSAALDAFPRAPLEVAENRIRDIGRDIHDRMPANWGFVLVMSSMGGPGLSTYLSSLERSGAVKLMRELADSIESGKPNV